MNIQTLASGSKGNAYIINDGTTALLIECGLPPKKLLSAAGYALDVAACLISHEHKDHSKAAGSIIARGIPIYASAGTLREIGIADSRYAYAVESLQQFDVGSFDILPFAVSHDAAEPLGFLIQSVATYEKLLFATDFSFTKYTFQSVNYAMVECNYSELEIWQAVAEGHTDRSLAERITNTHFSLEKFIKLLEGLDKTLLKQINLLHLSEKHSNRKRFVEVVQDYVGNNTIVI